MTNVSNLLGRQTFRTQVEQLWGIEVNALCPAALIEGSPERSLSRAVFEDGSGKRFLIEAFAASKRGHRNWVAAILAFLNRKGLTKALAPQAALNGEVLPFIGETCFQITRYLNSAGIERPGWLASSQMGQDMATFLIDMHGAAKGITQNFSFSDFSIKAYIYKLFKDMEVHHPKMLTQYLPILKFLEKGFMAAYDTLPSGFCHGDFHPLNVIWGPLSCNSQIQAVIDWEFTGMKPDCYDAANLVGCAGIEHPEGLAMPMVTTFLSSIKAAGLLSPTSLKWFPEYVLALRFAWLSEWLRKADHQMLDMELAFMNIVIGNMDDLIDIWELN